jgi:hypothetical protein
MYRCIIEIALIALAVTSGCLGGTSLGSSTLPEDAKTTEPMQTRQ